MKINIKAFYLSFLASIMIFLPSMLMILFHQSSFTLGIVVSSVIIIAANLLISKTKFKLDKKNYSLLLVIIFSILFVLLHFITVYYYSASGLFLPDIPKFILSFLFIIVCTIAAFMTKVVIGNAQEHEVHTTLRFVLYVLILNALISLSKIDFFNSGLAKPTFLFQEPSHFALVCAPLLTYFSFIYIRSPLRIVLLLMFGLWGVYIQNFTMILAVLIAYIITTKSLLPSFIFIILISITGYVFIESDFFSYYRDRLDLAGDSQNLSSLVLLQGWENSFLSLSKSLIGVGFQQYGTSTLYGEISEKIYSMLHIYINTFDAGSTAPKIIGEFGVFGIILILAYLFYWVKVYIRARRNRFTKDKKFLLFSSIYLSSFLEFFVRGAGYFTPSMFFFIVSVMYFISHNKLKKRICYEVNC
ncbi:hypothetical protein ACSPAH_14125 [Buttiauxella agrestis]